jgi:hypothetical protein
VRVVTNRPRIGRDGTTYPAIAHDRSELLFARRQETTLADWYADSLTGTIEVRIPWGMLHVLDPSSRMVLRGNALTGRVAGLPTDGFRFVVQTFDPADPSRPGDRLPRGDPPAAFGDVALWRWPMWEEPLVSGGEAAIRDDADDVRRDSEPPAPAPFAAPADRSPTAGRVP